MKNKDWSRKPEEEDDKGEIWIIEKSWVMKFRTPRGAWTREQLAALGVSWPPRKGWVERIEGTMISLYQKNQFIDGHARALLKFEKSKRLADAILDREHLQGRLL